MAPMRFACPHCKNTVTAPPERAGARAICPSCKLPLEVPCPRGELLAEHRNAQQFTSAVPPPAPDPFSFEQLTDGDEEAYQPRRRKRGNGTAPWSGPCRGYSCSRPWASSRYRWRIKHCGRTPTTAPPKPA
jgi:hypothetical protein